MPYKHSKIGRRIGRKPRAYAKASYKNWNIERETKPTRRPFVLLMRDDLFYLLRLRIHFRGILNEKLFKSNFFKVMPWESLLIGSSAPELFWRRAPSSEHRFQNSLFFSPSLYVKKHIIKIGPIINWSIETFFVKLNKVLPVNFLSAKIILNYRFNFSPRS